MRRFTISLVIATLLLVIASAPAGAWGVTWCRVDPIVLLNGTEVSILVAVPEEFTRYVNGPLEVVIRSPESVQRQLVMTDSGFNGHGETVIFRSSEGGVDSDGQFDAVVRVRVPIDRVAMGNGVASTAEVPVQVTIDPGHNQPIHTAYGTDARTDTTVRVGSTR